MPKPYLRKCKSDATANHKNQQKKANQDALKRHFIFSEKKLFKKSTRGWSFFMIHAPLDFAFKDIAGGR